eukprot:5632264-Prorocentrum_lima.AAC.1
MDGHSRVYDVRITSGHDVTAALRQATRAKCREYQVSASSDALPGGRLFVPLVFHAEGHATEDTLEELRLVVTSAAQ